MKQIKTIINEEIKNIYEDPDFLSHESGEIKYSSSDAVAFGYERKGGPIATGDIHYKLFGYEKDEDGDYVYDEWSGRIHALRRKDLIYPGRIWTEHKIISFWKYPRTFKEFYDVIKDLEQALNISILNNGYRVEVPPSTDDELLYDKHWYGNLIPVEEYKGGYKDFNVDKEHMVSPLLKKKREKPSYNKYKEIGLGKLTPAEYRAKKYKYVDENRLKLL